MRRETFGPPAPPKVANASGRQPGADDLERKSAAEAKNYAVTISRALGVDFEPHEALADPAEGCFVANPVTLKSLGKTIKLAPEADFELQHGPRDGSLHAGRRQPCGKDLASGPKLTSINHASAYVCRPRNGTAKLSEHALGNAIDIASFGLADGRRIDVKAGAEEKVRNFSTRYARPRAGRSRPCSVRAAIPTTRCISISTWRNVARGSTFCQ